MHGLGHGDGVDVGAARSSAAAAKRSCSSWWETSRPPNRATAVPAAMGACANRPEPATGEGRTSAWGCSQQCGSGVGAICPSCRVKRRAVRPGESAKDEEGPAPRGPRSAGTRARLSPAAWRHSPSSQPKRAMPAPAFLPPRRPGTQRYGTGRSQQGHRWKVNLAPSCGQSDRADHFGGTIDQNDSVSRAHQQPPQRPEQRDRQAQSWS